MKTVWTLEASSGLTYTFRRGADELKVFASTLGEAVHKAKTFLSEHAEIDVNGWEEDDRDEI